MKEFVPVIIKEFKVNKDINVDFEIRRRVDFIKYQLQHSALTSIILGLSGGVDSTVAGTLCKMAVDELNNENASINLDKKYQFIGLKLPYGVQADADDVETVFEFIKPQKTITANIAPTVDATMKTLGLTSDNKQGDFVKGNIKARERMVIQYAVANNENGFVVGTDHSAEGVMGFFTKYGDGACDIAPLFGLSKRQVRELGKALNVPEKIITKKPTADLEDLNPQVADEDVYGVTYDNIDDFLEGKDVDIEVVKTIVNAYRKTTHKRATPLTIYD